MQRFPLCDLSPPTPDTHPEVHAPEEGHSTAGPLLCDPDAPNSYASATLRTVRPPSAPAYPRSTWEFSHAILDPPFLPFSELNTLPQSTVSFPKSNTHRVLFIRMIFMEQLAAMDTSPVSTYTNPPVNPFGG